MTLIAIHSSKLEGKVWQPVVNVKRVQLYLLWPKQS